MSGAGNCSCGLAPAGLFDIVEAPQVSTQFLPDPNTGALQDAPLIDFVNTQDLVYGPNGELQGMDSVDQQVFLILLTQPFTSINPALGTDLLSLRVIDSSTEATIQNEIENSLNNLISTGAITLLNISVVQDTQISSRLKIKLSYLNNKLNKQRNVTL